VTRLVVDARMAGNSGIGTYLRQVLPRVLPHLRAHRPAVLSTRAHEEELTALVGRAADFVVWNATPLSLADLWSVPPVAGRDDVVWTPHFNVPLRGRQALAVTLHDLLPLTAPELAGPGRSLPVRAWLAAIRRRARAVMCVSQFTRGEAMRVGGLAGDRLHVTPLAADPAWFATQPTPTSSPTIVFVGLLKPHKNVLRLLRAFERVQDRIPHRLLLVAKHRGVRSVDRAALALAQTLRQRVDLVEDLPFADLRRRVASAQFAVQPSLHEGFGLPALEAMAAGVPVLAARAGALPEVCGDAAVYCDPTSEDDIAGCLLHLAGDGGLRAELAAAGRVRARSFSWEACARATQSALESALRQ
jgi:glycosyltransferase involved in cell wall biosynthesis